MTDNPDYHVDYLNFDGKMGDPAATPQPPPRGDGPIILQMVLHDLNARAEMGRAKYGTYLRAYNGRDTLMDLYQEHLDATMYLRQLLFERDGK